MKMCFVKDKVYFIEHVMLSKRVSSVIQRDVIYRLKELILHSIDL